MAARITKYLNKYVRRALCLIYISSFYFWNPPLARKIRKNTVLYYPELEWSTVNSYQAEALTNVLKYHTCRSSHPEDRKLPITELKWDARTVTNIPGNIAHCFFEFFWLTEGSRNKNSVSRIAWHTCIIPQNVCTCLCFINIYSKTVYTPLDWSK
jgi:hypothetical protein